MNALATALVCLGAGEGLALPPVKATTEWSNIGPGHWVLGEIEINRTTGKAYGVVKTENHTLFKGFAGTVYGYIRSADDAILARVDFPSIGQNSEILGGTPRSKVFALKLPGDLARRTVKVQLFARYSDGPPVEDQVKQVIDIAKQIQGATQKAEDEADPKPLVKKKNKPTK